MLVDDASSEVLATWTDGTFECMTGTCGDVFPCPVPDGEFDLLDVTRILNHYGYPSGDYPLCCDPSSTASMDTSLTSFTAGLSKAASNGNEVYLDPQDSSADYGTTVDVEVWVDATDFQNGQIMLQYDSACAEITDFQRNVTDFPSGTWDTGTDDYLWITFFGTPGLSVNYLIGTLTIHGLCEASECSTPLDFLVDPPPLVSNAVCWSTMLAVKS